MAMQKKNKPKSDPGTSDPGSSDGRVMDLMTVAHEHGYVKICMIDEATGKACGMALDIPAADRLYHRVGRALIRAMGEHESNEIH
jgi:hypothetical protein